MKRCGQGGFLDQAATRAIDNAHSALRLLQTGCIKKVTRLRSERGMQGDEIGIGHQIVQLIDQLDLQTARARRREIWIECHYAHAKSDRAPAQLATDPAHSDNPERFVIELNPFQIFTIPTSTAHGGIGLRNFPRHRKQKGKCVFGRGNGIATGCIEHDDPAPGRSLNIDIVDANAGAADGAQLHASVQNPGRNFRLAANDDGAEVGNDLGELRFRQTGPDGNFQGVVPAKLFDSSLKSDRRQGSWAASWNRIKF